MATPHNPFNPKASQAEEPHRVVTLVEAPPREQVKALIDMWASEGVDALMEGMKAFTANIETMAVSLDTSASEHADKEQAYQAASLGKQLEAAGKSLYTAGRMKLWELVAHTPGSYKAGVWGQFVFRRPRPFRATNLHKLETEYPEAYRAVVSVRNPKPGAVGALYLKPVSIGKDEPQWS